MNEFQKKPCSDVKIESLSPCFPFQAHLQGVLIIFNKDDTYLINRGTFLKTQSYNVQSILPNTTGAEIYLDQMVSSLCGGQSLLSFVFKVSSDLKWSASASPSVGTTVVYGFAKNSVGFRLQAHEIQSIKLFFCGL